MKMTPTEISVPDLLWKDNTLDELAKLLWCYFQMGRATPNHTYKELRETLGISQNTLLKQVTELTSRGLIKATKTSLRSQACKVQSLQDGSALKLPSELVFDYSLPRRAKWIWGLICRLGSPFNSEDLQQITGYYAGSVTKYLKIMKHKNWLVLKEGQPERKKSPYYLDAVNPFELQRRAEIAELERAMQVARTTKGYSLGQLLLARMIKLLVGVPVMENAELTGLDNPLTGGRLHFDLYIPDFKVALEFHGPQHDHPTPKFPSLDQYHAQAARDLIKLGMSMREGILVMEVRSHQLTFAALGELLEGKVPLNRDIADHRHIYTYLDKVATQYRARAALGWN